ncbi:MAG: metallophosphoesterase [Ruminococcus sp.]|nr:metallophosphoesterase [Ruminococcus sp.]
MIYITGDTHGDYDIRKLSSENFPDGKALTRSDYLIVCGDFGLVWDDSPEEHYWRNWLENKPWTTLWIDGNHENFDMLDRFDTDGWHGARVQYISDHIIHIMRGESFELEGKRFFCFGGAESHDKELRRAGVSWWAEELPSPAEMEHGRKTLEAIGWKTDIVITHSFPGKIQEARYGKYEFPSNELNRYFDEIAQKLSFRLWFSGHYHLDESCGEKYHFIYNSIVKLTDTGFEYVG